MRTIEGKVAVVTGAASGIGLAVASLLGSRGVKVGVVDLNGEAATAAARQIGAGAIAYRVDVSDRASVRDMARQVRESLGPPSILVNNAGVMIKTQPFMAVPEDDLERSLDVNLWGALHCTRAFLPDLLAQPEASIVNVASLAGLVGFLDQVPYSTGKFALRGFSEALRMELLETRVRVSVAYPGAVSTNIVANSPSYTAAEKAELAKAMSRMSMVSSEAAARQIVRGIETGKARILIGKETIVMDLLVRFLPGAYGALLHKPIRKLLSVSSVGSERRG